MMTVLDRVKGRRIGVLGMARSGMAVARVAKQLGATVFVSDSASGDSLRESAKALSELGIQYETGGHTEKLHKQDFVIVSPGISSKSPIVRELIDRGIPLFSELEFGSWLVKGKIVAVTGSNGKTTTSHMVHAIMQADGRRSWLCGNVGLPLSSVALDIPENGVAVVEVSSYQLEFIDQFAPHVAMIINLTPDHLERHGSMAAYREAKLNITSNQRPGDHLLLNIDSPALEAEKVSTSATIGYFGKERTLNDNNIDRGKRASILRELSRGGTLFATVKNSPVELFDVSRLKVPGHHNVENALAASSAAIAFGVKPESVRDALLAFEGVEHRIEYVGSIGSVRFVNDSKATNLDATISALEAITTPIRLILGGRGKQEDFRRLGKYMGARVKSVVAIGETREEIFEALGKQIPVEFANGMDNAVQKSFMHSTGADTVLLSPGCASFDMFKNFEHRGEVFKNAVHTMMKEHEKHAV